MTQHTTQRSQRYIPPTLLTPGQTLLWFLGGILAMFFAVSVVFAVKLGAEGRLPFFGKSAKANTIAPPQAPRAQPTTAAVAPPVAAATLAPVEQTVAPTLIRPDANSTFVPGTENLLAPEVAHLARDASPQRGPERVSPPLTSPGSAAAGASPPPPVAAPPAPPSAQTGNEPIRKAISGWVSAWQTKDVDAYLKHYADNFTPSGGMSRSAWLQQRQERLGRPGEITIQLSDLEIKTNSDGATARFLQTYSARGTTLKETKTLVLTLQDGNWLILQERIGQ